MADTSVLEEEKSAWNLSKELIIEIGNLLKLASKQWRDGKARECFFSLQEVKSFIWTDLTETERKLFKKIENKAGEYYFKNLRKKKEESFKDKKERIGAGNKYKELILIYKLKLMEKLGKYDYLISRKADSKRIV